MSTEVILQLFLKWFRSSYLFGTSKSMASNGGPYKSEPLRFSGCTKETFDYRGPGLKNVDRYSSSWGWTDWQSVFACPVRFMYSTVLMISLLLKMLAFL